MTPTADLEPADARPIPVRSDPADPDARAGLAHLVRALNDRCLSGTARTGDPVVVLIGAVGTGKTRLLHSFTTYVADSTVQLLAATGSRAEQGIPFGVVRQLADTASVPSVPEPGDTCAPRGTGGTAVERWTDALTRLVGERPTVIAVDDLHLADSASLACLALLADRIAGTPTLVVLTMAPQLNPRHPAPLASLARRPQARRLYLSALSLAQVGTLAARRLGAGRASALAEELHRISGGNPLLVDALIEDQITSVRARAVVAGDAFREAVLTCLHRCEPAVLAALRVLAVTGDRIDGPLQRALVGSDGPPAEALLINDYTAGLVRGGRLAHPTVARAILDGMSLQERARLHHRVAGQLHRDGFPPAQVARHVLQCGDAVEPWMAGTVVAAAEELLRQGRVERAVRYLRYANRHASDTAQQARILAALTRAEWGINPQAAVRHLPAVVDAVRNGHLDRAPAAAALRCLLWHGQPDTAVDLIRQMRRRCGGHDSKGAVDLAVYLKSIWMLYPVSARHHWRDLTTPTKDRPTLPLIRNRLRCLSALSSVLHWGGHPSSVRDAERVLREAGPDDHSSWCAAWALVALIHADRLELAITWCRRLAERVQRNRHITAQAVLATLEAQAWLRRGDLATAESLSEQAFAQLGHRSWGVVVGYPLAIRLRILTMAGRLGEAAEQLRAPVPPAMFDTPFGLFYLQARGQYALATGDAEAALRDFEACGRLMAAWRLDLPILLAWRTDAARAYLRLGRRQDAELLALGELSRLPGTALRPRGAALRVLAATTEGAERIRLLRQAVDLLADSEDVVERARALFDLGGAYQSARRTRDARRAIQAAQTLTGHPAVAPVAVGAERPATDPGGNPSVQGLSPAESRVVTLAAQGHTNREIAAKLFLTVSTVEQHLTKAYRKLQVDNRGDLARRLRFA
jgi:DNA-binding CsgD family transcriptional regulator/tetratricopeptide (TPR) repeat protein